MKVWHGKWRGGWVGILDADVATLSPLFPTTSINSGHHLHFFRPSPPNFERIPKPFTKSKDSETEHKYQRTSKQSTNINSRTKLIWQIGKMGEFIYFFQAHFTSTSTYIRRLNCIVAQDCRCSYPISVAQVRTHQVRTQLQMLVPNSSGPRLHCRLSCKCSYPSSEACDEPE